MPINTFWQAIGLTLISSLTNTSLAQTEPAPVYKVELIVFERLEQAGGEDPEIWPKNVQLQYPQKWQYLIDPKAESDPLRTRFDYNPDSDLVDETRTGAITNNAESSFADSTPLPRDNTNDPLQALNWFQFLPKTSRGLNAEANALSRAPELRVLFHQSWVQPMFSADDAASLIVTGGNQFGDHYELEGSIELFISRYIHIRTNLWLTQFVPNRGQLSDHWPMLPELPYVHIGDDNSDLGLSDESLDNREEAIDDTYAEPANPSQYQAAQVLESSLEDQSPNIGPSQDNLSTAPYLINQIITMKQARRMRSNELHYLDHPRLGILVKFTQNKAEKSDSPG